MTTYLDTNALIWLAERNLNRVSEAAQARLRETSTLLISPMVTLEVEYLFEVGRSKLRSREILLKAEFELGARICSLSLEKIAEVALGERWTRDPFDRLIVAHAKANGLAYLLSADRKMAAHYPRTIW